MFVGGFTLDADDPFAYVPSWRLHRLGMRAKRHASRSQFRGHAKRILAPMHAYYLANRAPATHILDQLGVPFEFAGDPY